ncbi:Ketopantoate reductase, partial [Tolypocladium paradoxum]
AAYLARQIATAPLLAARAVSSRELWLLQLEKLVVNASINPLTAILRCRNSGLFDGGDGGPVARVMDRLLGETSAVLQALVAHESTAQILLAAGDADGCGVDAARDRFSLPRLRGMLHAFGPRVGANTSSMLQDVQAGRQTEVRDFNGWLVDTAAFLDKGLDVSTHRALVDMVESGTVLSKEELGERLLV